MIDHNFDEVGFLCTMHLHMIIEEQEYVIHNYPDYFEDIQERPSIKDCDKIVSQSLSVFSCQLLVLAQKTAKYEELIFPFVL